MAAAVGIAIVIVVPSLALVDPVDFFTLTLQGVKVAAGVHLFGFFVGVGASLVFSFLTGVRVNDQIENIDKIH